MVVSLEPPEWPKFKRRLFGVLASATLVGGALLVVYIVGALLFTGGRVMASNSQNWGEAIEFPLFVVPAWLLTCTTGVALALLIAFLCVSSFLDAGAMNRMFAFSGANFIAVFFFSGAYVTGNLRELGWIADRSYVLPAALAALQLLITFVLMLIWGARYDRAKKRNELPEGYW